jgi:16S rRNA (adenine1518-N6/adenine1519-N6)-dimethyltransferase
MTNRPRSLLSETKDLLHQAGLHARKGLGQHFLVDGAYLKHILQAAELSKNDIVIEVGPGLGVLTRALAQQAGSVIAIEKDEHLSELLRDNLKTYSNITIINQDILKVDLPLLLSEYFGNTVPGYKVVANLPYYITSPVLRFFLEAEIKPQNLVVMVQKEVARQITAKTGEMSLLSVSIQLYGEPRIIKYVPARAFYPSPKVDSAILKINVFPKPVVDVDIKSFFKLVHAGFSAARKQIANPLSHGLSLPKEDILAMLHKVPIDPRRRAETLSIEEWGLLWQEYMKTIHPR